MTVDSRPHIVMLCTGNAARSVMGALMLRDRSKEFRVTGAGTHAIEGLPMSLRVRGALLTHGLADRRHLSHQLSDDDVATAAVIVAFAPEHVAYVRRQHPTGAAKTATVHRLIAELSTGADALIDRVNSLDLANIDIEPSEEVLDPAGGDEAVFIACADEINVMIDQLLPLLGS